MSEQKEKCKGIENYTQPCPNDAEDTTGYCMPCLDLGEDLEREKELDEHWTAAFADDDRNDDSIDDYIPF